MVRPIVMPRLHLVFVWFVSWSWLVIATALGGCATRNQGALTPLEPGQLQDRVALAMPGLDVDPVAHAREIAKAEQALGRPVRAAEAMALALARANATWWAARLSGDRAAIDDARRTLHRTAREALRWARRTDHPTLAIEAVLAHPHPGRHAKALRRALERLDFLPGEIDPEAILAVTDDAIVRGQIQRLRWHDTELLERLGLRPTPEDDALPFDLRLRALATAVQEHAPRAEVQAWAEAVLQADPWQLDAGLIVLALREVDAGRLDDDPLLSIDLYQPRCASPEAQARLHLRAEAFAASEAVALARAGCMLGDDLVGDASGALASMAAPTDPLALRLYQRLDASAMALRGRTAAFEHWRLSHGVDSPSIDAWLLGYEYDERPGIQAVARRARRRYAARGLALDETDAWLLAMDDQASPELRDQTRARFSEHPMALAWMSICSERQRDPDVCAQWWDPDGLYDFDTDSVVAGLLVAGRTPHFHPDLLAVASELDAGGLEAIAPVLAHYEGTRVAASPDHQDVQVVLALAQGRWDDARTRLEDNGALMSSWARTRAWLLLDDLREGRLTWTEARQMPTWWPPFQEPEPTPWVEPQPAPALRVEQYLDGMQLAQAGMHALALERLVPVLDAVPDEAVLDGLAQAALAAHLGGDAERRDALRLRLRAADPHGATNALLQARIEAAGDQHDNARRFLLEALRWNPHDHRLQTALLDGFVHGDPPPDADAIAFARRASTSRPWLTHELGDALRDGEITTLAELDALRVALQATPEEAWALEDAVLHEHEVLARAAINWGHGQMVQTTDLDVAHGFAMRTLDLLDATRMRSEGARDHRMWLSFLLGRSESALALARLHDPAHGIYPRSDGEPSVLAIMARRAGEIDDALAWDLWRWVYDIDVDAAARIDALLLAPPSGTYLEQFACGELTTRPPFVDAVRVCDAAWKAQPDSLAVAVSQTFLALNLDDPVQGDALAAAVFGSDVRAPTFLESPAVALGNNLARSWHQNQAVWLGRRGEHETAAAHWWQAYALGLDEDAGRTDGYDQLRWRGAQVRALQEVDDEHDARDVAIRRSMMALVQAETTVANAYAEQARSWGVHAPTTLDRSDRMLPDRLRHLSHWVADDLAAGRMSADVMPSAVDLMFEPDLDGAKALDAQGSDASIAKLALILAYDGLDEPAPARPLAAALLDRHPDDPLAVHVAVPLLLGAGDEARARTVFQRAEDLHPDDAMLRYIDAPESVTGPRGVVPPWVRDPARFDARLAAVTDADLRARAPTRHASDERAAELFVPLGWEPTGPRPLRFEDGHGARILVITSPRASRCQGEDCARELLEGLQGNGRTRQWVRQVPFGGPGGEATQAMLTNAEEILVAWVMPSGGRVFTVVIAAPVEAFDEMRTEIVMLRDGFRPLDAVLPPYAAESLRAAGPALRDGWRLVGRREQARYALAKAATRARKKAPAARPPEATMDPFDCPVGRTLAALRHDHQRAELLVDLWLATAEGPARRALTRCADPEDAVARRLALVALLDEDPRSHAYGRQAVPRHPSRVVVDTRTILSTPLTPPVSAPDYLKRADLPAHGLVEVLGTLPVDHARPLIERLLTSADPRDRTLAWSAMRLRPELATPAMLEDALRGEARLASNASYLLAERGDPADAAMLRSVLDSLPAAADAESRTSMRRIAFALASFLDPQDEARLRATPSRVLDDQDGVDVEVTRRLLAVTFGDYLRGRAILDDPSTAVTEDDERPARWAEARRRRGIPLREARALVDHGLAELLPGSHWTFARLGAPGLFSTTVADVADRLTTGDAAIDQRLGEITGRMLREGGFAALSASGGLDTTKPIECAKPVDDIGWLCTARVTDRAALLEVLGQRDWGDDSGLSLPLTVGTTAGIVPVVLSLMPIIAHELVYPDEDEDEDEDRGDEDEEGPRNVREAEERTRLSIDLGLEPGSIDDLEAFEYSIIDVLTRRISIDSERYVFVGDRLWVFSTDLSMERVLHRYEGPMLADDPEFRRLTAGWKNGAALQAVAMGRAWPLGAGGGSIEVVLDEGGLRFRYAGALESEEGVGDIGPAIAQLPEGAITTFAHGLGAMEGLGDMALEATGPDASRVPPLPVLVKAKGLAFGWYLEDGDHLWRRWLAVAPLDEGLRKALTAAKTPPGRERSRRHGGLCYHERAGFLLVGDCALVDRAAAGPPPPPPSADQWRLGHGTFDGPTAATRLAGLDGLPFEKKTLLRAVSPVFGVVTDMQVRADWNPVDKLAVLEGHVNLQLRPPGDRAQLIDSWLAASEGHNAATLPRRLKDDEIESSLRYVIEVPDADAFVRNTLPGSPRVVATVLSPTRVQLVVSPDPPKSTKTPLDAKKRKELTKHTDALPKKHPRIAKLARTLAPPGTGPTEAAEAIGTWVHERITYEVTPRSLSGVEILDAGRGDCSEYATLTVTLLRALDIPAEVRDGMAASGDEMVAHAWVAYHDGERWHEIDPTWGRSNVSAGHLEMSVLDVLALVSLGRLTVVDVGAP